MAEQSVVAGLKEELTCPICLSIYSNPVSLGCGHSFCRECLEEARSRRRRPQGPFSCPLCQARADPAAELQPNVQLRSIAQKFLDAPAQQEEEEREVQCAEKGESSGQKDGVILCDFCLQEPQPAAKTCLSCEASLCQAHLIKHNTKSPSKDHVLIEPCDDQVLAKRRCPQHGKLLECYCETDLVCICMLCCVMSSHKDHRITSLEEAFGRAQNVFPETLDKVKSHEAELKQRIENLLKQEEEVKTKEHLQKSRLESLFKEVYLQINDRKEEILKALRQSEEEQLSQIRSEIRKYKEMKDAVRSDIQELKALRDQKDHLLFVKTFAAIQARKPEPVRATDSVKLLPVIFDESKTDGTLRSLGQFLSGVQFLFKRLPVHEHLTFTVRSKYVVLSSCKEVTPSSVSSLKAKACKALPHVVSDQMFSEGCHFWEVDTSNATRWKLGIIHYTSEYYLEMSRDYLRVVNNQIVIREELPTALKVIRNPVSLSCGHSFCKQCIQKALGAQQQSKAPYSCPMCKLQLGPILELQKNFQLCSIVEAFLATTSKEERSEDSAERKKEVVLCDFCLERSQPAVKICLMCDAFLCQAHLDKHNAKASQQDHVLVEVGAGGGAVERRCLEHGRLLECYCQDEGQYICVLCSIAGCHKGHSIVTLKEAHDKQLGELSETVTWLQQRKSALAAALEELQKSENQIKTNTKTVTSQLQKLFEEVKTEMIQKEKKILSDIQSNEKKQLADITKVKKEMEQRRDESVQHLQSLQKMREQPDIFLFFKEFKLAKDRIVSQNFSVSRMDVEVVQLDQARIDHCRHLMRNFLSDLDSLLQGVHGKSTDQIKRNSGASNTGTTSNHTFPEPEDFSFFNYGWTSQKAWGAAQNQPKGSRASSGRYEQTGWFPFT
uniref:Uncharacterized protein n=1 Tax=Otus sunia TaxID=257818 RepID=A0A8C8AC60_9STRI